MKRKPDTEIALERIQNKFLKERNLMYLPKMYEALYPYVRSLLLKFIKNKIFLPPEIISDTTKDICLLIVDKYEKNAEFKIESSFAGYIKYKIMEILYAPQKVWEEQCGSLNAVLSAERKNKGKSTEIAELSEAFKFEHLFPTLTANPEEHFFKVDVNQAIRSVWSVFEDLFFSLNDINSKTSLSIKVTYAVLIFFRKNSIEITKFKQWWMLSELITEIYDLALLEIHKRLSS